MIGGIHSLPLHAGAFKFANIPSERSCTVSTCLLAAVEFEQTDRRLLVSKDRGAFCGTLCALRRACWMLHKHAFSE